MKKAAIALICAVFLLSATLCMFTQSAVAETTEVPVHLWNFEDGIAGWAPYLDNSAQFTLSQGQAETAALSLEYTYSSSDTHNWTKSPIFSSPQYYVALGDATHLCFDLYVQSGHATTGSLSIHPTIQSPSHSYWFALNAVTVNYSQGESIEGGLLKYSYTLPLTDSAGESLAPTDIINYIVFPNIGVGTDYSGTIMYDNIRLVRYETDPEPSSFTLERAEISETVGVAVGDTVTVECEASGGTQPYSYAYYALKDGEIMHKSAIWSSSSAEEITFPEAGTYKIVTYCRDAVGEKGVIYQTLTVEQSVVKPSGISLSANTLEIDKGQTATLTATVTPADAANKTVTWSSSDETVASVDQNGTVTAISAGTAVITATTCNGLTAVCEVTVIRTVPAADKYIALTFDDGPDANSGVILDAFAEHNAKCTFFVLYTNAQYNSSIVQRIANEGHELGNHTKTHNDLTTLPPAEAIEEIEFVNEFIYGLTGQTPVLYRPPYLSSSTAMLNLFPDMSAIGCSIDTRDWSGITKEEIVSSVVNNARDGAIVLMHCTMPNTRAAVPEILEQLEDMGYACVTVSELFEAKGVTRQGAKYYSNVWG